MKSGCKRPSESFKPPTICTISSGSLVLRSSPMEPTDEFIFICAVYRLAHYIQANAKRIKKTFSIHDCHNFNHFVCGFRLRTAHNNNKKCEHVNLIVATFIRFMNIPVSFSFLWWQQNFFYPLLLISERNGISSAWLAALNYSIQLGDEKQESTLEPIEIRIEEEHFEWTEFKQFKFMHRLIEER